MRGLDDFTLPWRGRVGSHGAQRNARRGGVTVSQLGHCSKRETVTPPRRFASTLPLQGRVNKAALSHYNPNTIFATISRWISDEPPKIVYARPLRYSGTTGSISSGMPGASLSR
jgi:hypothetical protein